MLFARRNQLVGLDIGTHSVKVVEIVDSPKGHIIKKIAREKLPHGFFKDGEPRDPVELSLIIKNIFQKKRITDKNVALSIGGYSAIVKTINLTIKEGDDIGKLVFEEAEHYIPFDINDVNIDYQVMGPMDENPNKLSILLVAAKKDIIEKYIEIAENAGLNPMVMDVDAFAVQNIFELNEPDIEEAVLVNIGASKISVNIVVKGRSVFMREVSMGSGEITSELMILDPALGFEDAEDVKMLKKTSPKIDNLSLDQVFSSVSSDWCLEIARALDFFYSNYPGNRVEKVFICGGGSKIERFEKDLSNHIDADVKRFDPLQVVHTDKTGLTEEELEEMAPELCVALGLGLRKMDDK